MQSQTLDLGRRVVRKLKSLPEEGRSRRRREHVARILTGAETHALDSQAVFDQLQAEYQPKPDYGYDPHTTWWRGVQRAHWVLSLAGIEQPGARVLDVACGDGMAGRALAEYGHQVTLTDIEDWRDARAKGLEFVPADVGKGLPLEDASFDAITSFNAFIHFLDPAAALRELVRLCKPGGVIHLDFGFLYPSAWGLHAYRTVRMPYAQFLFTPDFLHQRLDELGFDAWPAQLGKPKAGMIPLNGWRLAQYREAFASTGCETISSSTHTDASHLELVERFPQAFAGRGLTVTDLETTLCSVTLRKPGGAPTGAGARG
jgi:SAM-dependent methyltransferase